MNSQKKLTRLSYIISTTEGFAAKYFYDILRVANRKNSELGISGFLIWTSGHLYQLLKGPWDAVMEIFEYIEKDERHREVLVICKEETVSPPLLKSQMDGCMADDAIANKRVVMTIGSMAVLIRELFSMCEDGEISQDLHDEILDLYSKPILKVAELCYRSARPLLS